MEPPPPPAQAQAHQPPAASHQAPPPIISSAVYGLNNSHHQQQSQSRHSPPSYGVRDSVAAATAQAALSQQQDGGGGSPATNGSAMGQSRKRRASGAPSSRGVANLTPEQLAKKRANDREAQRAIRERTRNTIETLELRIKELESQQPFQDLQRVVQERDRALTECEELKRRLAQVVGIAGGVMVANSTTASSPAPRNQTGANLHELATVTAQQSPMPPLANQQSLPQYSTPNPSPAFEQTNLHPDLRSPNSVHMSSPGSHTTASGHAHHYNSTGGNAPPQWTSALERTSSSTHSNSNGSSTYDRRTSQAATPAATNGNAGTTSLERRVGDSSGVHHRSVQQHLYTNIHHPRSSRKGIPANLPPTCTLDGLLEDFINDRRAQLRAGTPPTEVLGPDYPAFDTLPTFTDQPKHSGHALSALIIDMCRKFPDFEQLPEQVAVVYVVYLYMRWLICSCETCWNRVPAWIRPTTEQVEKQHAHWNDYLPWPILRSRLVRGTTPGTNIPFEDFFVPYTASLSLNWPYPHSQVLQPASPSNTDPYSTVEINPVFESHLLDLSNWSLGTVFQRAFPELVGNEIRIVDRVRESSQ